MTATTETASEAGSEDGQANAARALAEAAQALREAAIELRQATAELRATRQRADHDPVDVLRETVPSARSRHPSLVAERRVRARPRPPATN